ncbi:MAG: hypothetical protein R3C10_08735 [Pirellulales bacterium]
MTATPAHATNDVLADAFDQPQQEEMLNEDADCWRHVVLILLSVISLGVTLMTITVVSIFKFGG